MREVLDHWRKTGRDVSIITAHDAAEKLIAYRASDRLNPKTKDDIRWRLRAFAAEFGATPLHQIVPGRLEEFIRFEASDPYGGSK
ncbi:MAG TPA: hypothetical protein VE242_09550 [Chthoniobacterales bacterium]|nr:hypothetical protein [Chthoniobacterales bacterium]